MAASLSTQLEGLRRERERLEELLMLDANWRALRQLEEREAAGQPLQAVDGAELKESLGRALGGNRIYVARTKLLEMIELLSADFPGRSPVLEGGPLSSRIVMLSEPAGDTFRARLRLKPETVSAPDKMGHEAVDEHCEKDLNGETVAMIRTEGRGLSSLSSRGKGYSPPIFPVELSVPEPVVVAACGQGAPDPLELIDGLDRRAVELLLDGGVTKFAQIARWSSVDVATWRARLDGATQGSAGSWIEQAAILAKGHSTLFAERARRGEFAALVPPPQPEPPRPWSAAVTSSLASPSVAVEAMPPALPESSRNARCVSADELVRVLDHSGLAPPPLPGIAARAKATNAGRQGYVRPIRGAAVDQLSEDETDVVVDRAPAEAEAVGGAAGATKPPGRPRTLLRRMKALHQAGRFEADDYAAYRGSVEEASVTILAAKSKPEPTASAKSGEVPTSHSASRFLKALTGKG